MNVKNVSLATLGGAVVFFFAGWLIWGMFLENLMQNYMVEYTNLKKPMPNMGWMVASMFVSAFLLSYIFDKWAGIKTFSSGAKAGALICVLIGLGHGFMAISTLNLMSIQAVGIELVGNLLWGALGGGTIGWILGKLNE